MRNAEITNGRVAMIAITIYAYEEALLKAPIFPINLFRGPVAAVSDAVGDAVGAVVSAAVDTPLVQSGALDSLLAAADQAEKDLAAVGDAVGDAVGNAVGDAVGDAVAAVGSGVVDAVGGM